MDAKRGYFWRSRVWPTSCCIINHPARRFDIVAALCGANLRTRSLTPPSELRVFFVLRTAMCGRVQCSGPEHHSRGMRRAQKQAWWRRQGQHPASTPWVLSPDFHAAANRCCPTRSRARGIPLCRAPHRNDRAPTAAPGIPPAQQKPAQRQTTAPARLDRHQPKVAPNFALAARMPPLRRAYPPRPVGSHPGAYPRAKSPPGTRRCRSHSR